MVSCVGDDDKVMKMKRKMIMMMIGTVTRMMLMVAAAMAPDIVDPRPLNPQVLKPDTPQRLTL